MKKNNTELPKLTQEPVEYVDSTPDENYPIRILEAYRENCNSFWEVHGLTGEEKHFYDMLNEHQISRAKILDKAINKLKQ